MIIITETESELNIKRASQIIKNNRTKHIYLRFMALRFNKKSYISYPYAFEWALRFISGDSESYMDYDSKRCFIKAIEQIDKGGSR